MLAQKAGLFVLTLVGDVEGSDITYSDPHSINSVIEGLRLMECVHIHVLISTSSSDKTSKNREMNWFLGELKKSRISSISQEHIARFEAKMVRALEILQKSSQQTTNAQRTFVNMA